MRSYLKKLAIISVPLTVLLFLGACSNPKIQTQDNNTLSSARLMPGAVAMPDGYILPMKTWPAAARPVAVVLAMHGFNDYSNAFDETANSFAASSITSYAIDQRGFGATEQRGIWAGQHTMQSDLVTTINLLCEKHTELPVYVLGESMGGAVILSAIQQLEQTCVQGVILSSPAVWGWQTMPWWQTVPLRFVAHTLPEHTVTGEGLEIKASDNVEMLRALGRDPLIIKETRIDAIYGLTDLMEAALLNSDSLKMPALILYGEHDEIIPADSFCEMLNNLPDRFSSHWRLIIYPDGYHMLSRDLQGEVVIRDMAAWIHDQESSLPSGGEIVQDRTRLSALKECDQ